MLTPTRARSRMSTVARALAALSLLAIAVVLAVAACGGNALDPGGSCHTICSCSDVCVQYPGAASFCTHACTDNRECMPDERCAELDDGTPLSQRVCVPPGLPMGCPPGGQCFAEPSTFCHDGQTLVSAASLGFACGRSYRFCGSGCVTAAVDGGGGGGGAYAHCAP
jgi:hypothetical protein